MISLFSKRAQRELRKLCGTKTLYAFDFDGTLAPIVKNPASAQMISTSAKLFTKLTSIFPVAVVSGRSVQDLKARLQVLPKYLIGNHGLENGSRTHLRKAERLCKEWIRQLESAGLPAGAWVENKKFSFSIHYRDCKQPAKIKVLKMAETLHPAPRLVPGKLVLNVVPKGAPDKGTALLKIMRQQGFDSVLFIGDDETDEDVFKLKKTSKRIFSIRVGKKKSSHATYFIRQQKDIKRLLSILLAEKKVL